MACDQNRAFPAVYLLLQDSMGRYLIARRRNTGYQDGNYNVPSGHVEMGELPKGAMVREAKEEIAIDIDPDDLTLVHVSYRPKHDETGARVDFFFAASRWTGDIINAEPHKCDDLRWISVGELPANTTPHVRHAMECVEQRIGFSELDVEFLKKHGVYLLPE